MDVTENCDSTWSDTEETSFPNESTNSVMADEHTKNIRNKTENKRIKIMNSEAQKLKIIPYPDKKNLKRKTDLSSSEMVMDPIKNRKKRNGATNGLDYEKKMDVTENLDSTGSDTEETSFPNESTNSVMADERTKNIRNKTENKRIRTMNSEAQKLKIIPYPDKKNLKRKTEDLSSSKMVMDPIKNRKKRNGATFDGIKKPMKVNNVFNIVNSPNSTIILNSTNFSIINGVFKL